ncbi:MAG: terminase small subunit [Desulfovibrio sp.]|nr:terminase small subunit [Desulfovibrio sp.]
MQELFVKEYLVDLNATQAAIRAGYSAKTANAAAGRLLVNVSVAAAIQAAKAERMERVEIKADDVLKGIVRCTTKAEDAEDYKTALKGLELQGKHLGLFTDKVQQEVSGPNGGPVQQVFTVEFVKAKASDE